MYSIMIFGPEIKCCVNLIGTLSTFRIFHKIMSCLIIFSFLSDFFWKNLKSPAAGGTLQPERRVLTNDETPEKRTSYGFYAGLRSIFFPIDRKG